MAKKGFFRRVVDAVKRPFGRKKTEPTPPSAPAPAAPTPPVHAPQPAPKVRHETPEERAEAYIADLRRRGKEATYPRDETYEFWRAVDERGGTP